MPTRTWTTEQIAFLKEHYGKLSYAEIGRQIGKTAQQVKSQAYNLKITVTRAWPKADTETLRRLYPNTRTQEIADLLCRDLSAVYGRAKKLGLEKSPEFLESPSSGRLNRSNAAERGGKSRFQKGQTSWNKGKKIGSHPNSAKTQFRKGQKPHNAVPVGTEVVASSGYLKIKVAEPNVWEFSHKKLWREHHGPIPRGHMIAFIDGNRMNCTIENLECISHADWMRRHTMHNYPEPVKQQIHILAGFKRKLNRYAKKQDRRPEERAVRDDGTAHG